MEKNIDWEEVAKLLEEEHPSTSHLNEQELQAFIEMKELWHTSQHLSERAESLLPPERVEEAKAEMWARIEQDESASHVAPRDEDEIHILKYRNRKLWPLIALAASIALLIGVFLVAPQTQKMNASAFATSEEGDHTLPDDTEIRLQYGSLKYNLNQKERIREVSLEGKAHFQVAKDQTLPFVIDTEIAQVKVIGTAFTLSSRADPPNPVIEVEEGVVAFQPKEGRPAAPIILRASEQLQCLVEEGAWQRTNTANDSQVTWEEGQISIDLTLRELAQLVTDLQDKPVEVADEGIAKLRVSTSGQGIDPQNPEEMLEQVLLPLSHAVELEVTGRKLILKKV